MVNVAIDFGGTNIKLGLIQNGCVIAKRSLSAFSSHGLIPRLADVERAIKAMVDENGLSVSECNGIGMAVPGLVDPVKKRLLSINAKYADAIGYPIGEWAEQTFAIASVLENDARAALLGEVAYGVAQGETDAVLMTIGTGIGTAVLMNGQIVRGRHHQAGVLGGHLTTDVYGNICNCGNQGCLEAQASLASLPSKAKKHPLFNQSLLVGCEVIDYLAIVEGFKEKDAVAADLMEDLIEHWSAGIINLIHAYDPEVVVLSGGVMKSAVLLVPYLEERVHRLAWTPWGKMRFVVAQDPDVSVLLGLSHICNNKHV